MVHNLHIIKSNYLYPCTAGPRWKLWLTANKGYSPVHSTGQPPPPACDHSTVHSLNDSTRPCVHAAHINILYGLLATALNTASSVIKGKLTSEVRSNNSEFT